MCFTSRARLAALAAGIGLCLPAAGAQPSTAADAGGAVRFALRGFRIEGENPLGEAASQALLARWLRPDAELATLQQAAAALESALAGRGFGLYRVVLPPQAVGETVTLQVVHFRIGQVRVEGQVHSDAPRARAALPELREGATPDFRRLAVQTAIANESAVRQLQLVLAPGEREDEVDATLLVRDQRPWRLGLALSNEGSAATGRDRLTVFGSHGNVFNREQQLVAAYTTSPSHAGDVRQLGLAWRVPLYASGGVLALGATRSDVVGDFGSFRSTGAGHTLGLAHSWYLPPQGARRRWITLGLEQRHYDAARIDGQAVPGLRDRETRPLTLGWTERSERAAAVWQVALELALNAGAVESDALGAYRSEDPRIARVHWRALRGAANWQGALARDWRLALRSQFQWSPDALVSGEQFGLGSADTVRGTRQPRALAGDSGAAASTELSTPEFAPGLRVLGFVDAGAIGRHAAAGAARPASDIIASVGLGLRWARGDWAVSADYARIAKGSRVPAALDPQAPQRGDDHLHFNFTLRY